MRQSIPTAAWVIIVVEFFERMAYYATAFTLMTYCTDMLLLTSTQANLVVNILYVISPLSAVIGSGLSDGSLGRRNALLLFLAIYVVGLSVIALSTFPFMYDSFPRVPGNAAKALFMIGIGIFGVGYGGMKVCTSPLMADACVAHATGPSNSPRSAPQNNNDLEATLHESEETTRRAAEEQRLAVVSRLFRVMYWSINFGSLFGIIGAPMLRQVDWGNQSNGMVRDCAAYYAGFSAAAVACACGFSVFLSRFHYFPDRNPSAKDEEDAKGNANVLEENETTLARQEEEQDAESSPVVPKKKQKKFVQCCCAASKKECCCAAAKQNRNAKGLLSGTSPTVLTDNHSFVLVRVASKAIQTRLQLRRCTAEQQVEYERLLHPYQGLDRLMMCAALPSQDVVRDAAACEESGGEGSCFCSAEKALEVSQTLGVCRTFATLPLYWLISNQFSTNVVVQAGNMNLPSNVPPEAFNNVNTAALLVTILICDRWVFPWLYGQSRPPVVGRMVLGFLLVSVSMLWCGVLQLIMDDRGTYQGSSETYILHEGESLVNAMWLIGPYALQGIGSVFVDCTVLESAYLLAPRTMKSSVMALYLLASSGSGFLGLALSPMAEPRYIGLMFFVLALAMALVTVLYIYSQGGWNGNNNRSNNNNGGADVSSPVAAPAIRDESTVQRSSLAPKKKEDEEGPLLLPTNTSPSATAE
jgi:dipeptide/tripeptide permease